jgi:hypothetical protein
MMFLIHDLGQFFKGYEVIAQEDEQLDDVFYLSGVGTDSGIEVEVFKGL